MRATLFILPFLIACGAQDLPTHQAGKGDGEGATGAVEGEVVEEGTFSCDERSELVVIGVDTDFPLATGGRGLTRAIDDEGAATVYCGRRPISLSCPVDETDHVVIVRSSRWATKYYCVGPAEDASPPAE